MQSHAELRPEGHADGIAIVGLAGRFPGARDVVSFWRNLCAGVESIEALDPTGLENAPASPEEADRFVPARGLLPDADRFDAAFFGMHPREAELTDPQHRVLLETCWEALEDAGYDPATSPKAIGVYAGCSVSSYFLRHVLSDRDATEKFATEYQVGSFPELLGSGADFLATKIAYKLNLRGPAMTVQSACSTALLAVAQACQTLWLRQADMMLAGAVSISFPQQRGYVHQAGGMVSSDGHCRTFDANSSGTVFGAGAGVVVLKRLSDARRDGDAIYAVIRGAGVNNDGSAKAGYSAPSVEAQAAAIVAAQRMAGFEPATIDYVECHGTATPLGDPIEVAALASAFGGVLPGGKRCALGSVKPNVGHLDVAAGMAGLIKTALALRFGKLPATLHYTSPNPLIDFEATPFYVNAALSDWPSNASARRAGVSAFGVGGTNVHLVLENEAAAPAAETSPEAQLFVVSARTDRALAESSARLAAFLDEHEELAPADVAFTLQTGRRAFERRHFVTATSNAEASTKLQAVLPANGATKEAALAFMFPGQGSQYVGMGRELYATRAEFGAAVDRCCDIVAPLLGTDLRTLLFPANAGKAASAALSATAVAQPAIFILEYALAHSFERLGLVPVATLGHSVGEFVSATLAGVFTLEDALRVVVERGRLMQAQPPGAMLAVRLSESDVTRLLEEVALPSLGIAALNAPLQSVVAGRKRDIAALERVLGERNVLCKRVETSHAFHSPMMDPVREPLTALLATLTLRPPERPYVSTVTGRWIEPEEATSPAYWADHARQPVRFSAALTTLLESGANLLFEVGPGTALASSARQIARAGEGVTVVGSPLPGGGDERTGFLEALGHLWTAGAAPDWSVLRAGAQPRRVSLPAYPFEPTRHWIDAPARNAGAHAHSVTGANGVTAAAQTGPLPAAAVAATAVNAPAANISSDDFELELAALLEDLSGERIEREQWPASFLELGFDSLFLGRFVQQVNAKYGVRMTFRQLLSDLPSLAALGARLRRDLPSRVANVAAAPETASAPGVTAGGDANAATIEAVVREQLAAMQRLMQEQLALLARTGDAPATTVPATTTPAAATQPATPAERKPAAAETPARFDAFRIAAQSGSNELTPQQRAHVADLIARVTARTSASKAYAQRYRAVLADPRVAAGFRAEWKEMVYPIVCDRAAGSKLWDIDGNEYIDLLNGFGQTAFGHAPDFVVDAVGDRLERGFAIGPQSDLAGETAELFCAMTGNERMTFCNTGSEAVMAALRVARTVTGRDRVVLFDGAYHGQFDEVLVKSARTSERSLPVAPGIPAGAVSNVTVLAYGAPESLAWIREHANELAAVVVEPVQSRRPALQPREFLHELRGITEASGTALVFDEVVTGFRMHPAGMQHVFGVRADLATYGKVAGGGLPIGILAGKARFMDALDGGMWQYGDDSVPEVAPTFFAGTFVRHPLALASMHAVLKHLEAQGPSLQADLGARTSAFVAQLNAELERRGLHSRIDSYGSLFYFNFSHEERLANLLYFHLRARGVYLQEGFPCFLTTEHSAADLAAVVRAFGESLDELQAAGIFVPAAAEAARTPLVAATQTIEVPLTEAQTEVWLAAQLGDDASCAFNESLTLRLRGALDERALGAALDGVVARHEALRASYGLTGETMRIAPALDVRIATADVSAGGPAAAAAALEDAIARDARTPFDLSSGPLVRAQLLRLGVDDHALVLTAHHIVCDGWSMNVVLGELAELYAAVRAGRAPDLAVPLAFSDYARAESAREQRETASVEAFWREQFASPPQPLELPTDRPRRARRSFDGATRSFQFDAQRYAALKRAGAKRGCTLFVTLLAGFAAFVGRLGKRDDVVIGIPAAAQSQLDDAVLVGHCVDFLPIRNAWETGARLRDLLASAKQRVLDAYEHQHYTLGTLVRVLDLPRESNRVPLTEIQFNLERLADGLDLPGLSVSVEPNPKAFVNFDLFLNAIESSAGLRFDCDYNAALFDAATIDGWLQAYCAALDAFATDPEIAIDALPQPQPRAAAAELSSLAGPVRELAADATVHALFEAQVAAHPDAIAASCGDAVLTYAQLEAHANQLAHHLLARTGGPGKLIGIALDRSLDMLVALLAVLKAGCAYVPLDPKHPEVRLRQILSDAAVAALIVDGTASLSLAPPGTPLIDLAADSGAIAAASATRPAVARSGNALAYAIYTSGSTGVPKGVEIEHRSVVNLLAAMARRPGLTRGDGLVAVTTISFDIAALELFLPLAVGARVAIATAEEAADGFALLALLQRAEARALQATPATWRLLLEAGFSAAPGFKMLCGGEALHADLASALLAGEGELWNVYGPTETTIWSSCARVLAADAIDAGLPVDNTQLYVLDDEDRLVPRGTSGQLHIAGDGVARGYLGQPARSAEKFVANPFGAGRLYRTGDRARITPAGALEILGRIDQQVKLRGFRIELGEIESALAAGGRLAGGAVALREDAPGQARLVGYYVERAGATVAAAELQSQLATRLPDYMVPATWMRLDALPLTPNGKLDRAALPAPPAPNVVERAGEEAETLTETERALVRICAEVLSLERIGAGDDLFALGADSIQLFKITARANRDGLRVAAKHVFAHRTIGALARHLDLTREVAS